MKCQRPAIEKVPFIEYHGFDNERSKIMQELAKNVLILSKEENDSNEVAITCDLGTENPLEIRLPQSHWR